MADVNFFDLEDGFSDLEVTVAPKVLRFTDDYDGLGNSRRLYTHNGTGLITPYTGTIDNIVITETDPRYTDVANAPPVVALLQTVSVVSGNKIIQQGNLTSGNINLLETDQVVWFQIWNNDGSYHAIGTMKVQNA